MVLKNIPYLFLSVCLVSGFRNDEQWRWQLTPENFINDYSQQMVFAIIPVKSIISMLSSSPRKGSSMAQRR